MIEVTDFAIVGLGRVGGNFARQALEKGYIVYGLDKGPIDDDLERMGLQPLERIRQLRMLTRRPRVVFIFITDDRRLDQVIDAVASELDPGDVIIDASESQWRDSIVRHHRLKKRGVRFIDLGITGGATGARSGACLTAGGEEDIVLDLSSLFRSLAAPEAFVAAGPPGCGHFAKCIHDEIESKMQQALLEGMRRLELHSEELEIEKILESWNRGSDLRSDLLGRMVDSFKREPHRFTDEIGFAPAGPEIWRLNPH